MKQVYKNFPVGALPYEKESAVTKMMVKLFENIPYLPCLPIIDENENLIYRTLTNAPGIKYIKENDILISSSEKFLIQHSLLLDEIYNNPTSEKIENFAIHTVFLEQYFNIIKKCQPKQTIINLYGVFTTTQILRCSNVEQLLVDKNYRKFIVQTIFAKSAWIINKIKKISPKSTPIIVYEEPFLYKAGALKRENEEITHDTIVNILSKLITKIHELGAKVCIQCFEKCDWSIPIDAGVDIISFAAYNNPSNLNIIPEKVNEFLVKGGKINWAIVPIKNESIVKSLTIDYIYDRFIKTVEALIDSGTSEKYTYNNSTVSIQGNVNHLPIIFAEKALILANQLSKKIPHFN